MRRVESILMRRRMVDHRMMRVVPGELHIHRMVGQSGAGCWSVVETQVWTPGYCSSCCTPPDLVLRIEQDRLKIFCNFWDLNYFNHTKLQDFTSENVSVEVDDGFQILKSRLKVSCW